MKKDRLAQIKAKYGSLKDEMSASSVGEAIKMGRDAAKIMKSTEARDRVWEKKRDAMCQLCGLKPDADGFYDYDKIDMKNPLVELEYFLCDPSNRAHTSQHLPREKRQRYLEQHLSKEAIEIFWDPEKGAPYDHSGTPWNTQGQIPYYKLEFRFGDVRRQFGLGNMRTTVSDDDGDNNEEGENGTINGKE